VVVVVGGDDEPQAATMNTMLIPAQTADERISSPFGVNMLV
jgi:hypothetical protein